MRDLLIPLCVGLALLLFGMEVMRIGLNSIAGKSLEDWLARFTRTPLIGFISGTIATSILQSSSAITVITVGLVNTGLITFRQSIGIILGANVGTTITLQLIALPIEKYSLPLFILGFILWLIPLSKFRFLGLTIGGFATLIIGLITIGSTAQEFTSLPTVYNWLTSISENTIIGILVGTVITAIIQSSTATTALMMSFVESGLIPLVGAIAIILGSNIGTCITAYLASLGGSKSGKQVAYAHILLNLFGVLLFIPFIKTLALCTLYLSDNGAAQVAHAQTIFNIISSLIVLPFADWFGNFVERIAPART